MSWFSKKSVWIQDKDRDLHNSFYSSLEFIRKFKPFLLIFNGDIWHRLLARENFISNADKVGVTDKFNLYFIETLGIRSVLFDKFFSRHFGAP
jgi:hypothetical protein